MDRTMDRAANPGTTAGRRGLAPSSLGRHRLLRFRGRSRAAAATTETPSPSPTTGLYRAIGHIAVNWSSVEISSGFVLMHLLGSTEEALAQAVVAGQRVENVWETTEVLLATHGEPAADLLAAFRHWRREANALRRRRNEVIHSGWSLADDDTSVAATDLMSQKAKRGARRDLFPDGVVELESLATDIAALEDDLVDLYARYVSTVGGPG